MSQIPPQLELTVHMTGVVFIKALCLSGQVLTPQNGIAAADGYVEFQPLREGSGSVYLIFS